jgi:hypothetical protein
LKLRDCTTYLFNDRKVLEDRGKRVGEIGTGVSLARDEEVYGGSDIEVRTVATSIKSSGKLMGIPL